MKYILFLFMIFIVQAEVGGSINIGNPPKLNIEENHNITGNLKKPEESDYTVLIAGLIFFALIVSLAFAKTFLKV
jgi:hypothetical protein